MIEVREIAHLSPEYDAVVELRREVLRRPLGLDYTTEQLASEGGDVHLAGYDGEELVACLILSPHGDEVKMRQVAVSPTRQRQGVGRLLVEASERVARDKGFDRMVLHARDTAVPFYEALGYSVEGAPFEEVGIPHRRMSKPLTV